MQNPCRPGLVARSAALVSRERQLSQAAAVLRSMSNAGVPALSPLVILGRLPSTGSRQPDPGQDTTP